MAFAPDGRSLATAGNDGTVRLYEPTLATLTRFFGPDNPYTRVVEDNLAVARLAAAAPES